MPGDFTEVPYHIMKQNLFKKASELKVLIFFKRDIKGLPYRSDEIGQLSSIEREVCGF